jgi:hypothetical protein
MSAASCLVLYGNSVFLAGIKADLERRQNLELITIEAGTPDAAARIGALKPRAVLFDLCAASPDFTIPLLRDQPGLVLVGVDPATDEMLRLTGQRATVLSLAGLADLLDVSE